MTCLVFGGNKSIWGIKGGREIAKGGAVGYLAMNVKLTKATRCEISQRGISLIESLIGTGLLGIVLLATCGALTSLFSTLQFSRENLRATQILIEKMEICRLYSWEQITDPTFFPKKFTDYLDPIGATNGNGGGTEFSGTMSVRAAPNDTDYSDDMKTIIIDINWGGKGNHARYREFITSVTRNGLQSYLF